jgi:uncharacterized protein (DUF2235 family)
MAGLDRPSSRKKQASATDSKPHKLIFLFSDGTGNSSAKLQKTNVWRLYEALDLGTTDPHIQPPLPVQIAYYDNGVGTSSVPLLAALGGVFGFGLPRNVRGLYSYLCRNYEDGDRIYAFGFSRGAFTIRLLIAMVVAIGIVRATSEIDLELQVRDAWREFRSGFKPYVLHWPTHLLRRLAKLAVSAKRFLCRQAGVSERLEETEATRFRPDVEFVGVWDTVAAYGGPIVELTRAVDMMVWPLSMPDFRLSEKVRCARHVLAIDDKRDSFIPLPWDEKHEQRLVGANKVRSDRLQQVFFAGMHADVGGGYADDSLGYVSLVWMIDQLGEEVRLQAQAEVRIRAMANSLGPIHDSRRGVGMLYRYQVRPIAAWLHPRTPASWPLLDPSAARGAEDDPSPRRQRQLAFGRRAEQLLIGPIKVHCSVAERLDRGTDGYAPNNLPVAISVVDNDNRQIALRINRGVAESAAWTEQMISLRRFLYFSTIVLLALMLAMPWWPDFDEARFPTLHALLAVHNDERDLAGPVYSLVRNLLPGFLHRWTDLWVFKFWLTVPILLFLIIPAISLGNAVERRMADHFASIYGGDAVVLRRARRLASIVIRSRWLNWLKAFWKWYVVPAIVGIFLLLAVAWAGIASVSQFVMFMWMERSQCAGKVQQSAMAVGAEPHLFYYDPSHGCSVTGARVEEGKTYTVQLADARWSDGGIKATPSGWSDATLGDKIWGAIGIPFRRVIRAPYLAPVAEIVPPAGHGGEMLQRIEAVEDVDGRWTGRFTATRSGTLLIFLNDVVLPADIQRGNAGWRLTFFNVRVRAANNRFEQPAAAGKAIIWQGSVIAPSASDPAGE